MAQAVQDFYVFMEEQVEESPVWLEASPSEIDNVMEGIEKTLMNKLYDT